MSVSVEVRGDLGLAQLERLEATWRSHDDVSLTVAEMSVSEMQRLLALLIPLLPNSFYSSVLETIAERPSTPVDLLSDLFDAGDEACQMSICLRDDLTEELREKCALSAHVDVREHFARRQQLLRRQQS